MQRDLRPQGPGCGRSRQILSRAHGRRWYNLLESFTKRRARPLRLEISDAGAFQIRRDSSFEKSGLFQENLLAYSRHQLGRYWGLSMTTLALALGAGGARGLAHIHALKAFDDLGVKPAMITGTSIGALIGAAYCSGMSGAEIETYIIDRVSAPLSVIGMAFELKPKSFGEFLEDGGPRIGEFNLERILSVLLPKETASDFENMAISFKAVATDYYAEQPVVFSAGPLLPALAASAAMPAIFLPVEIEGRFYIDGSSTNPCPFDVATEGADRVIAVDVSGGTHGSNTKRPNKVDVMYGASQLMQQWIVRSRAQQYPDIPILRPPVDHVRPLNFLRAREILEETKALYQEVRDEIERT